MMGYGMMGGGSIMMLLWIVLIGAFIYLALKNTKRNATHPLMTNGGQDAIEIAKSRLAKGEISIEEFEQIKNALQ